MEDLTADEQRDIIYDFADDVINKICNISEATTDNQNDTSQRAFFLLMGVAAVLATNAFGASSDTSYNETITKVMKALRDVSRELES